MKGEDKFLMKLMDGSDNRFIIPVYQRNYDWGIPQCKQLFEDLVSLVSNNRTSHFFGCIVRANEAGGRADDYLIIDGQQRMTTVCLIVLAIYWNIKNGKVALPGGPEAAAKLAKKMYQKFIVDEYDETEKKIRLKLNKHDREAFDLIVASGNSDDYINNSNVTCNYKFFYDNIQSLKFPVDKFYEALFKLVVIDIFLNNTDDPQLIFESLNSTGLDLTESDKIRNFVLMGLSEKEQENYYYKYWSKMENNCPGKGELDDFIRDYLILSSPTGETPTFKGIYSAFKKFCGSNVEQVLGEMCEYSVIYSGLKKSSISTPAANDIIRRLNFMEMTVTYPFLLGFLRYAKETEMEGTEIVKVLSCIETFIFRRLMCDLPTNALNKIFAVLHQQVKKNKKSDTSYSSVMTYILENRRTIVLFPKDEEFILGLTTKNIYNMRAKNRSYLFDRLENGLSKEVNDVIANIESGKLSVEHIMPQTLTEAWIGELGPEYYRIREQWLHTLANLTLTGYNSQYGNRTFAEKKADENGFANSGLRLNQYIKQFDKWTEDEMKLRKEHLAEIALKVWPYPETDFTPAERQEDEVSLFDEDFEFKGRQIVGFSLIGTSYNVQAWVDALVEVLRLLFSLNPTIIYKEVADKDNIWFSDKPQDGFRYREIGEKAYICVDSDTNTKIRILRNILRKYDLADDDLILILRPIKKTDDLF